MALGKSSLRSVLKTVLLTSLVFVLPIVAVRSLGGFEGVELAAYDDFLRRRSVEQPDDRIVIMTISDNDIERLQQFPIHDGTLAQALQKLESYKPRAIGMDISRDVPQGAPAGRKQLIETIASSETIVSGCLLSTENHPGSPPAPGTPEGGAAFADFPPDTDQVIRRVRLISTPAPSKKPGRTQHLCNNASAENEIPSLSFQLAVMYLAATGINPEPNARGEIQLGKRVLERIDPSFGSYVRADVNDYQMMLNYRSAKPVFREVSISDVLQNRVSPGSIRDRVVLIGNTSEVSKDFLATPFIQTQLGLRNMHGVIVHAHAVSQILSAVLNQRPPIRSWSDVSEPLWIWVWSISGGLLAFYSRRLGLLILALIGTGLALWGISYGLFLSQALWIPFVPTLIGAILTALGVRLADLAQRSGYAQALYEQLREQMQSGGAGRDRKGDYLENLVRRARAARQGEDAAALVSLGMEPGVTATPAMKALYEQMATKVRQELAAEQFAQKVATAQTGSGTSKTNRMQALLSRAQQSRTQPATDANLESPSPENSHA
ncbi:CHASE2 domain-containing protein [Phormidium sp. CLA17]|uniref:CHASE2 domain-containing protein n=1 Tax=Leptolyngbya sp. Cla-17 TaxID=2803751 RepID=UPI001490B83C|nr:CHASE2 domain-containing protein [Leptolyngbya sp. Cla-17]MBM0744556.1 CHASE2 domain-containing protein [Leptolyngbya sp. Cla-17]